MRLHEEFTVDEPVATVWQFFDQAESVAICVPGVEEVTIIDADRVNVRATQSIGPMTATFDATVTVLERIPNELIRFRATGKSIRGAIGNLRTENSVRLLATNGTTTVTVDGDVVLAGALGSVGQKIVAKQASKVTAEFAANLQRALKGDVLDQRSERATTTSPALVGSPARDGIGTSGTGGGTGTARTEAGIRGADGQAGATSRTITLRPPAGPRADPWSRVAAALSALSAGLSVIVLLRQRRNGRQDSR